MHIIEQIVDIPDGREIVLKLPESVPTGSATLKVSVSGYAETIRDTESAIKNRGCNLIEELKLQAAEKTARRKASGKKPFAGLYGIFKDSKTFAGDSVEIVRSLREEWNVSG